MALNVVGASPLAGSTDYDTEELDFPDERELYEPTDTEINNYFNEALTRNLHLDWIRDPGTIRPTSCWFPSWKINIMSSIQFIIQNILVTNSVTFVTWGSFKNSKNPCSFECCNFMLNLFYFSTFPGKLFDSICPWSTAILINPNEKFCQIPTNILNRSEFKFTIRSHYTLSTRLPKLFSCC